MLVSELPRGGGVIEESIFHEIVSVANLFSAWKEFKRGKLKKNDVAYFDLHLEDSIFRLHTDLATKRYFHDTYTDFYICDPKRRHIHKATVRDRVLHQAIFRVLYPIFDEHFIYDSYSSREYKGTHKGVMRLASACRKVSKNWKAPAYALKCDIRKFFDSIDHDILRSLIQKKVSDSETMWLIDEIFNSFEKKEGKGLPLGNVTSQLFANVYMNEFDQFVKHSLKTKHYFRYCDDFVIVHSSKFFLEEAIKKIEGFLKENLELELHPLKVEIRKVAQGVDFLGYVILPYARVIRTKTKRRIMRKIQEATNRLNSGLADSTYQSMLTSYVGVLSHAKSRGIRKRIERYRLNR